MSGEHAEYLIESLQKENERLRTAHELAEEAAKLALRTGKITHQFRQRILTMLDRARAALETSHDPA